jgi:hypothetical protein
MATNLKKGDHVIFSGEFFTVSWIDDSGESDLIGLVGSDDSLKVISFSERIVLKVPEEET